MDEQKPFVGYYSLGQYVTVRGSEQVNDLRVLGNYGYNLEDARRKNIARRGPLDRQLIELSQSDDIEEVSTLLTLQEAFFLAHSFECLSLVPESDHNIVYNLEDCWTLFRNYYAASNDHLDFAIQYGVYHFFRSRGWVVKQGDNYGTNYLLYKNGPTIDHARYAVLIIDEDNSTSYSWESLLTFHRITQSVSKELLLVYVVMSDRSHDPLYPDPDCIKNMRLTTKVFSASSNVS